MIGILNIVLNLSAWILNLSLLKWWGHHLPRLSHLFDWVIISLMKTYSLISINCIFEIEVVIFVLWLKMGVFSTAVNWRHGLVQHLLWLLHIVQFFVTAEIRRLFEFPRSSCSITLPCTQSTTRRTRMVILSSFNSLPSFFGLSIFSKLWI